MSTPTAYIWNISYTTPGGVPTWGFTINPPPSTGGTSISAKIRKSDTITWTCNVPNWMVFFKGGTPLETIVTPPAKAQPLGTLGTLFPGMVTQGVLSKNTKKGDIFKWGVLVPTTGGNAAISPDPEIIIDETKNGPSGKKKKKAAPKPKKPLPKRKKK